MAKVDSEIVLGEKYKDQVTGFTGTATAITLWLNGCIRVELTARKVNDKGNALVFWIDEQNAVPARKKKPVNPAANRGGPRNDPRNMH